MRIASLLIGITILVTVTLTSTCFAADQYTIDPEHSKISFKVRHMGISSVSGVFGKFSGTFSYVTTPQPPEGADATDTSKLQASATIDSQSIDTGVKKRDDHLRSADFLDTAKYPQITYNTTKIESTSPESFTAYGDLSIHGVTKPVTIEVTFGGLAKDPWGNERAAFSASTKINRKDFGIVWNKLLDTGALVVGDEVKIELEIEGIKSKI